MITCEKNVFLVKKWFDFSDSVLGCSCETPLSTTRLDSHEKALWQDGEGPTKSDEGITKGDESSPKTEEGSQETCWPVEKS